MIERLDILHDNKVISTKVYDHCVEIHHKLFDEHMQKDAYNVFMTHLAMAYQRIVDGNIAEDMDEAMLNEIKTQEQFEDVLKLTNEMLPYIDIEIPSSEMSYIYLHLTNLLRKEGQE